MNGPLENELKERNERLETATERLSDRELEISILQKRLEIRSSVSKKGPNKINCLPDHQDLDLTKCSSCTRKDGLISCLFEKVNLYESAILGTSQYISIHIFASIIIKVYLIFFSKV